MKKWKRITALALTVALAAGLLSGCGGAASSASAPSPSSAAASTSETGAGEAADWTSPYSEPVAVTIGRGGSTINWPDGEDFENNAFTSWIEDTMNIDVSSHQIRQWISERRIA